MANDNELIIKINGSAKDFLDELEKVKKKTKELEKALSTTAKVSAAAFAAFSAAIAVTTKSFIDYEKALVGVGKTTNIEGKRLEKFGKQFQKLSQEIPVSTNELLGIAQAAGQLGVTGEKNLLKFTETVAKLGVATDLSGEQAATTLTRILNATGEGIESIDTFGSVIVALGNNFAATESEIARMANEVARATGVFDVSAAQAAALGTAMRSVGIQAELGGSVVGKSFRTIDAAVRDGGKNLKVLADLAGVTGEEFTRVFEEDSTAAFQLFIEGLGDVVENGGSAAKELEKLGLKGDEVNKVLPILAKNSELVGQALKTASDETKNATALNDEAAKAYATLGAETDKLINTATNLSVSIGEKLAPTIKSIIVDTREFLESINNLDNEVVSNVATFLKWGAAISGVVAGIAAFLLAAIKVSAIIAGISAAFLPATLAASAFWVALTGPIGIAIAGVAAITAGVLGLKAALTKKEEPKTLQAINDELEKLKANRDELQKKNNFSFRNQAALNNIKKEIRELEKLKEAKTEAGELLLRPDVVATASGSLGADAFGFEGEQTIPFAPEEIQPEEESKDVEETKKREKAKTDSVDAETQKRIDLLKKANAEALRINQARSKGVTEEEKTLAARRAEIENEFRNARSIKNEEERKLALENLNLKHAEELASITEQERKIFETRAEAAENQKAAEQILREEEVANRELLTEEDLVALGEKLESEEEVKKAAAEIEAARVIEERNQFLADEQEFGENFARINQFFRNKDLQNAQQGAAQLIQLTKSKNDTLSSIGRAAASVNAAIATGEGAIKAYSALAGIPIVGPALGAAAAGALIAFGVEQQSNILGANQGGLVPQSAGRAGVDSVPAMLTPNEIVAPAQSFNEVVEGTALARGFTPPDEGEGNNNITITLEPTGDFVGMIEQKQIEAEIQNTNVR